MQELSPKQGNFLRPNITREELVKTYGENRIPEVLRDKVVELIPINTQLSRENAMSADISPLK